jgi:hypothetical protein
MNTPSAMCRKLITHYRLYVIVPFMKGNTPPYPLKCVGREK